VPGARVSHVGVVGTVLGGGDGWLSIRHGLSADNLLHADVVTGDGRLVRASADAEHELFWALCGGRTDLGVVMSMTLALHPLPATVLGGMLLYPLQDLGTVLDTLRALHAQGCREFAGAAMVMAAPPASFVPGDLVGRAVCAVLPAWFGDVRAGHDFVAPLRTRPRPLVDAVGEQAYTALQAGLDGLSPWGLRQASRASVLRDLPPQLAADVVDAAMALPTRGARISISRIGGAMARPNDAAAYPWRSDGWLVNPTVQWRHRRHDARNTAWLRQLHADVRRRGEVATSLNHESANSARVAWLFGLDRWTRLQATKAAWDPTNLFAQGVTA
jgi:FAD/FMN-containing dehydrogenase